jgi:AraC-like DNA-binding protein
MLQTAFDGGDLPPAQRLSALDELFMSGDHPMGIVSDAPEDFGATARTVDLGAVNVVELTVSPSGVLRTPRMIRRADPELCSAIVAVKGKLLVGQAGREAVLGEQDIAFYDSSLPFALGLGADAEPATIVRAHIPRALLRLSAEQARQLAARPLTGIAGFTGLLSQFLTGLSTGPGAYRPADVPRLGTLAQDLLAAVAAHHLDTQAELPEDSHRRTLLLRIEGFIGRHLHDPSLSPGTIAAAHHISVGHLHRLFSARETTVAAWIRDQRLERARRDLADPAMRHVPVHRIAARWGFKDHPTFTRAFRSAYGATPQDHRHLAYLSAAGE